MHLDDVTYLHSARIDRDHRTGNESVKGGGDETVIINNYNHSNGSTINFTTAGAASIFRLSRITIKQDGNSTATKNGIVNIGGYSQNFRMDHMHFIFQPGASSSLGVELYNWLYGVIDHCIFDENSNTVNNGVRISHGSMGSDATGAGNGSWASPTNFGSNQFIFFENNVFNGGAANDCNQGGRFVFRNNTFNDSFVEAHEMEFDYRGCAQPKSTTTFSMVTVRTPTTAISHTRRAWERPLFGATLYRREDAPGHGE